MNNVIRIVPVITALAVPVVAQQSGPPPVMQIIRETLKEGKSAAHEKTESEYVQAFRKAKDKGYYLAATSMSGMNEAWFFVGQPSFEAVESELKATSQEPLKSELELADAHDGALRESTRSVWAIYRPDLSYRADKLDVGKMRYFTAGTYRVRLGHEADMVAGAKQIMGAYEKGMIEAAFICYQVVAGAPSGTYMFFSPMESLKVMDGMRERQNTLRQAMGADNMDKLMRGTGDTFLTIENQLFAVSPRMSYVSDQTAEADPAFWRPKPAAKAKPAQ